MRASTFVAPVLLLVAALLTAPAAADVKIAFIDPLSGGGAATGILAQKTHQFYIDAINAAGGVNGEKIELLSFDNKVNPQESLIQLKKALDEGARFVVQGNGSSIAHAITEAVLKHNERNPGKEVLFLNYAAVDPALTNEKCNFWHFRFDADADMKMAAITDVIAKDSKIKRVYLINQDYSFGKAVAAAATKMLAEKRPDIKIVGDELHPLQKVQDFSPYVAKIKASGADTVITGNWSNDMVLLVKAGKDAGLKVGWDTFYGGSPYLGTKGTLPTGTVQQNVCGEWYFPLHSHALNEFSNFDEGFGGMGTLLRVDPFAGCTGFVGSSNLVGGTLKSGSVTALAADDANYYQVNPKPVTALAIDWYAGFTGVAAGSQNLRITYKGKNCATTTATTCTALTTDLPQQTVKVCDWTIGGAAGCSTATSSGWVTLPPPPAQPQGVGSTEVGSTWTLPGSADRYIGTGANTGQVRVLIHTQRSTGSAFSTWANLLTIRYDAP